MLCITIFFFLVRIYWDFWVYLQLFLVDCLWFLGKWFFMLFGCLFKIQSCQQRPRCGQARLQRWGDRWVEVAQELPAQDCQCCSDSPAPNTTHNVPETPQAPMFTLEELGDLWAMRRDRLKQTEEELVRRIAAGEQGETLMDQARRADVEREYNENMRARPEVSLVTRPPHRHTDPIRGRLQTYCWGLP